jgi:hypothetical protein
VRLKLVEIDAVVAKANPFFGDVLVVFQVTADVAIHDNGVR